jgi:putative DNA primase/helicase
VTLHKRQKQIGDFLIGNTGVFYIDDRGPEPISIHVCSRLDVLAVTHDSEMNNWGKLCSFVDPRGNEKRYHVLSAQLMSSAKVVVSELIKQGLVLSGAPRAKTLLVQYLQATNPTKSMVSSLKLGWVKDSFLLPNGTASGPNEIIYAGDFQDHGHGKAGNWKKNVGRYCSGNSRLILAASAAFAAPLLELADIVEGGGFHFRGGSSIGKSTAQEVAASVYGSPDHVKLTCDATKGSFEKIAEGHNDQLMIIEELGLTDPGTIGETIYMLANGMSKSRMAGRKRRWRVLSIRQRRGHLG